MSSTEIVITIPQDVTITAVNGEAYTATLVSLGYDSEHDIWELGVVEPNPLKRIVIDPQDVFDAMERYGGEFVKHLAGAWRRAPRADYDKLYDAFRHYYHAYEEIVLNERELRGCAA